MTAIDGILKDQISAAAGGYHVDMFAHGAMEDASIWSEVPTSVVPARTARVVDMLPDIVGTPHVCVRTTYEEVLKLSLPSLLVQRDIISTTDASVSFLCNQFRNQSTYRYLIFAQPVNNLASDVWPIELFFAESLTIKQIKSLISGVSKVLNDGRMKFVDDQLRSLNVSAMGNDSIVALLRVTFPARSKLSAWDDFMQRANSVLVHRGTKPQRFV